MNFNIEYSDESTNAEVIYVREKYYFNTLPQVFEVDVELCYNTLTITVSDDKIVQLWGYVGSPKWITTELSVPSYRKGNILVNGNFEYDICYRINDEPVPVYHDIRTGWVCMGDFAAVGTGVMFLKNSIAVINKNQQLVSLWINPVII